MTITVNNSIAKAGDIIMFIDEDVVNNLLDVSIDTEYMLHMDDDGELFFLDDVNGGNWAATAEGVADGQFVIVNKGE